VREEVNAALRPIREDIARMARAAGLEKVYLLYLHIVNARPSLSYSSLEFNQNLSSPNFLKCLKLYSDLLHLVLFTNARYN